ncbi:mitochondrial hypoxia responsive domain-containing protein [Xylaria nigripes]|nr:mitochondrial hypoxia responsive domain-containing protein [Xylaria nigripes]
MSSRPLPSSFDGDRYVHCTALTCLALYNAWRAMRRGDHAGVQRMFRARIGAQAFTVIAMVAGGAYYGADREKRKELVQLEAQKRAEERNQKWLHELEIRDEEDKKLQVAIKRKRDRLEQRRAEEQDQERELNTASPSKDTTATKTEAPSAQPENKADASSQETGKGSSVLSALSSTGGWFGTKKEPVEQDKKDTETPKK